MQSKRILLVVGGGIAAYKACELIRLIRAAGGVVTCVLTEGGARFVTAMTLAALSENPVHTTLWDADAEARMGHIHLSRDADLVVVCPATADLIAKMAAGIADDLASTLLLATTTPVLVVPAMNPAMWAHPATQRNVARLGGDGVTVLAPDEGAMACGEVGAGRLPEPAAVLGAITARLAARGASGALAGRHVLVTAGPTHEPIDPVRYIANRSSGKQGFAIAAAAAEAGARVTLVAGPVALATPPGVTRIDVTTAHAMAQAVAAALPADVAVMAAAVADWRVAEPAARKLKKHADAAPPALALVPNPDILARLGQAPNRPALVIGFAAETGDMLANAAAKRIAKHADWIVANDVSGEDGLAVIGGENNRVAIITAEGVESLPAMPKAEVARHLIARIADALG